MYYPVTERKTDRSRVLAFITAAAMIFTLFSFFDPGFFAVSRVSAEGTIDSSVITDLEYMLSVKGTPIAWKNASGEGVDAAAAGTVSDGDTVSMYFKCHLIQDISDQEFYRIQFTTKGFNLRNIGSAASPIILTDASTGEVIGSWFVADNAYYFKTNGDFNPQYGKWISADLTGNIDYTDAYTPGDGLGTVNVQESGVTHINVDLTAKPKELKNNLSVSKAASGKLYSDASGNYYQTYTITLTASSEDGINVTGIDLTDYHTGGSIAYDGSVTVSSQGSGSESTYQADTFLASVDDFRNVTMVPGETITLTYTEKFSASDLFNDNGDLKYDSSGKEYNYLTAEYDDANNPALKKTVSGISAHVNYEWGDAQISKYGMYRSWVAEPDIEWTITVTSSNFTGNSSEDLTHLTSLSDEMTYNGSVDTLNTAVTGNVTRDNVINNGTFTSNGSGGSYKYTYYTKVDPSSTTSAKVYNNVVTATIDGRNRTDYSTVNVEGVNPLSKEAVGNVSDDGTVNWEVTFKVPSNGVSSLAITDIPSGYDHAYVENSMSVSPATSYTLSSDGGTITFTDPSALTAGTDITVSYQTKAVTLPAAKGKYTFSNRATAVYRENGIDNDITKTADASKEWEYVGGDIDAVTKTNLYSNENNSTLWRIEIDGTYLDGLMEGSVITVNDSAKVLSRTTEGGDYTDDTGLEFEFAGFDKFAVGDAYWSPGFLDSDPSNFVTYSSGSFQITVTKQMLDFCTNYSKPLKFFISYYMTPSDFVKYQEIGSRFGDTHKVGGLAVVNAVSGEFDGNPIGSDKAICENPRYSKEGILDKSFSYDYTNGSSTASYSVDVNKGCYSIGTGDTYKLVDTMGSALVLRIATLTVDGNKGSYVIDFSSNTEYATFADGTSAVYYKDSNKIIFTLNNDMQTHKIAYSVGFSDMDARGDALSNTIAYSLNGDGSEVSSVISDTSDLNYTVKEKSQGGSEVMFRLLKADSENSSKYLEGAVFTVTAGTVDTSGTFTPYGDQSLYQEFKEGVPLTYTTDEKGEILIGKLRANEIYRLDETEAPEGYQKSDPTYIMIVAANNQLTIVSPPNISIKKVINGQTCVVYDKALKPDMASLTVIKRWQDKDGNTLSTYPVRSVTVNIYDEENQVAAAQDISPANSWKYVFELEKNKTYTVEELGNIENFETTYTLGGVTSDNIVLSDFSEDTTLVITNKFTLDERGSLEITKVWDTGTENPAKPDLAFTLSDGTNSYNASLSGEKYVISGIPLYKYSFAEQTLVKTPIEYTLTETMTGDNSTKFVSDLTGDNAKVKWSAGDTEAKEITVTNKYETDKVVVYISKQDFGTKTGLAGAELKLYRKNDSTGEYSDITDTDADYNWISGTSAAQFNLLPGTYKLKELSPPSTYLSANDIIFEVKDDGKIYEEGGTTAISGNKVVMYDYKGGSVTFRKVDADGNTLNGHGLGLAVKGTTDSGFNYPDDYTSIADTDKNDDGRILNYVNTNGYGTYRLEDGEYTITEYSAPDGYKKSEPITFTIKNGTVTKINGKQNKNGNTVTVENELDGGSITVVKQDTNGKTLSGAKLALYINSKINSNRIRVWESGSAPEAFTDLANGKYILTEIEAPDGYSKADDVVFNIVNGKVTEFAENKVVMEDEAGGIIKISKQTIGGTTELPGAVLTLYRGVPADNDVVESWTSGTSPHEVDLKNGVYTLREVTAPENYLKAEDVTFTVTSGLVDNGTNKVTMVDNKGTDVKISKRAVTKEGGLVSGELDGASLKIYRGDFSTGELDDSKLVEEWVSGTQEHTVSLEDDTYTLAEITAPAGYAAAERIVFTVADGTVTSGTAGAVNEKTVIMKDKPGSTFMVSKRSITGTDELPGAKLRIFSKEAYDASPDTAVPLIEWTSGETAREISLEDGDYVLVEITAPAGYLTAKNIAFSVNSGMAGPIGGERVTVGDRDYIIMKDAPGGTLNISKRDVTKTNEIAGAELYIFNYDKTAGEKTGSAVEHWTSANTPKEVKLDDGTYILIEHTAPDGYAKAESVIFEVKDGKASVTSGDGESADGGMTVIMVDAHGVGFEISKYDITNSAELPGAELTVKGTTNSGKNVEYSWTSGSSPTKISLEDGTYTLTEITAPTGYAEAETISFTVDHTKSGTAKITAVCSDTVGKVTEETAGTSTIIRLTMFDKEQTDSKDIYISKTDISGSAEIAGARLTVYKGRGTSGDVIASWTSGSETDAEGKPVPHKIQLADGAYTLVETTAPDGYAVSENIEFMIENGAVKSVISADGNGSKGKSSTDKTADDTVIMKDNRGSTFYISKMDINKSQELVGAILSVYDENSVLVEEWTSDGTLHKFSLKDGNYTLKETKSPSGYMIAETIGFTVDSSKTGAERISITSVNSDGFTDISGTDGLPVLHMLDRPGGDVTFVKVNDSAEPLSGAEFDIWPEGDPSSVKHWTTPADGKKVFENLPDGTYIVSETKAPDGYCTVPQFTLVVTNGVAEGYTDNTITIVDKAGAEISFSKQEIAGGTELPGAKLTIDGITSSGAAVSISWTSGTDPHKVSLENGTYTLTEITAPEGFIKAESISFTVSGGKASSSSAAVSADGKTVTMKDARGASVRIGKSDPSGKPLAGAKLVLRKDGVQVENGSWTSDGSFREFELPNGTYVLSELADSDLMNSYCKADDVEFTVNGNSVSFTDEAQVYTDYTDNTVKTKFSLINKKLTEVTISKQNIAGDEIPGAKLSILNSDGTQARDSKGELVAGWTSAAKLSHTVRLADGDYILRETQAPDGYEIAEDIGFRISGGKVLIKNSSGEYADNENGLTIVMKDEYVRREILISKQNIAGDELVGAKLTLYKKNAAGKYVTYSAAGVENPWISNGSPQKIKLETGDYQLLETGKIDGYKTASAINFTVTLEGTDNIIIEPDSLVDKGGNAKLIDKKHLVMIDFAEGKILISKRDINGTDEVIGAKLEVFRVSGGNRTSVGSWTSDGTAKELSLDDGDYVLAETTAPYGYETAEEIAFTVNNGIVSKIRTKVNGEMTEESVSGSHIIMKDAPAEKKEIIISKRDVAGEEVENASLTLYSIDGTAETAVESWVSSKNSHKVSLYEGTYKLVEVIAPDDYRTAESIVFTVDSEGKVTIVSGEKDSDGNTNGSAKGSTLIMTDKPALGKVLISKRDAANKNDEVIGAKLELRKVTQNASGEEVKDLIGSWTSDGKSKEFSLADGTYILTESSAPNGYFTADEIKFTVLNGKVTETSYSDNHVVMFDCPIRNVIISKQNVAGEEIEGAKLTLESSDGTFSKSWTSKKGVSKTFEVKDGEYTLTEVTAPDGYEIAESITFTVENGVVTGYAGNKIVMLDKLSSNSVLISKENISGAEIPGASLSLYKGSGTNGEKVASWVSGDQAKLLVLEDGTYTLTETNAPSGYSYADDITFTVKNGKVTGYAGNKVVMIDEAASANISISKQNVAGDEVSGAKLVLYRGAISSGKIVDEWVSGNTPHTVVLADGTYTLEETNAPEGYKYAQSITFTVKDGRVVGYADNTVVMTDQAAENNVIISLKNPAGSRLNGGQLVLSRTDGGKKVIKTWITRPDGSVVIELEDGEYIIEEITAPDNYIPSEVLRFTVKDGVVPQYPGNHVIMINDTADNKVLISKKDVSGNEIPGAKLTLYKGSSGSGEIVETWVSGSTAKLLTLDDGTYTLVETGAPNGYRYADNITFKVSDGKVVGSVGNTVTMVDYAEGVTIVPVQGGTPITPITPYGGYYPTADIVPLGMPALYDDIAAGSGITDAAEAQPKHDMLRIALIGFVLTGAAVATYTLRRRKEKMIPGERYKK